MTSDNSPLDVVQIGKGRNLVLLYSLLSDRTAFDRIAPRLAAERRVWLVNLPGFGASAPAGPGLEQMADRIAEQLPKLGLSSDADLLGNGFGGFISVELAVRHGDLFDRLVLAQFDRRAELGTIRNPTLVVVGLRDTATPPALSYELATGIPGAALVELPQCGHSPHIQDPEGFWQAIKPFLQLAG
ncbi:MAG TPA: alpha/beta fold hydrolase [Reyranella sp.]|nr:alpha/beta fold hydrolase [Reyranella sp.]